MNKCLKIMLTLEVESDKKSNLQEALQKHARTHELEGIIQLSGPTQLKIIACGQKEAVDAFVDAMHKEIAAIAVSDIEIEPYVKDKDYRGVFRVIE